MGNKRQRQGRGPRERVRYWDTGQGRALKRVFESVAGVETHSVWWRTSTITRHKIALGQTLDFDVLPGDELGLPGGGVLEFGAARSHRASVREDGCLLVETRLDDGSFKKSMAFKIDLARSGGGVSYVSNTPDAEAWLKEVWPEPMELAFIDDHPGTPYGIVTMDGEPVSQPGVPQADTCAANNLARAQQRGELLFDAIPKRSQPDLIENTMWLPNDDANRFKWSGEPYNVLPVDYLGEGYKPGEGEKDG